MDGYFHSVTLDKDKCCGCTNCIKRCPTEAIRVRDGKALIISERCIDCGECIRVCPHHAKRARSGAFSDIHNYKHSVAIPAPALFGQFNNLDDIDIVLTGLKKIGFDSVFEVSRGAEYVSEVTRMLMHENKLKLPVISSACPAVVRLIRVRFPELIGNVLPLDAPMEVAAMLAKEEISNKTGLPLEDIGAFFITPCPAKVTDVMNPIGRDKSWVNGTISVSKIYPALVEAMEKLKPNEIESLAKTGIIGISWASSGGEAYGTLNEKYLAADGIENVIKVLEELDDQRINDIEFIELNACSGGCVGGVMNVENAYIAQARIQHLRKYLPVSQNHLPSGDNEFFDRIKWDKPLDYSPVMNLSNDIEKAMEMMEDIDKLMHKLPKLDCGSCGAPSCRAMAEDVIKGSAQETDCIFILKEQIRNTANMLSSIGGISGVVGDAIGESIDGIENNKINTSKKQ